MKGKGQVQLEAIACFACFLGILALFLAAINESALEAGHASKSLKAKARSEACCIAADALYATGAEEFFGKFSCTAEGNLAKGRAGEREKESLCLGAKIRLVQNAGKSSLEVEASGHYG